MWTELFASLQELVGDQGRSAYLERVTALRGERLPPPHQLSPGLVGKTAGQNPRQQRTVGRAVTTSLDGDDSTAVAARERWVVEDTAAYLSAPSATWTVEVEFTTPVIDEVGQRLSGLYPEGVPGLNGQQDIATVTIDVTATDPAIGRAGARHATIDLEYTTLPDPAQLAALGSPPAGAIANVWRVTITRKGSKKGGFGHLLRQHWPERVVGLGILVADYWVFDHDITVPDHFPRRAGDKLHFEQTQVSLERRQLDPARFIKAAQNAATPDSAFARAVYHLVPW